MTGRKWTVPADAEETLCGKCRQPIYFVLTPNHKRMPVDCEAPECRAPTLGFDGHGVSHFETCPHAAHYSGRNRDTAP